MNIKGHHDGRFALLAGTDIHGSNVDLPLGKYLGNIHKHTDPVICKDLDLCGIPLFAVSALWLLPLCIDQTAPLGLRKIDDIDTICPVDGHTAPSGDKTNDLVSRNRAAAPGEPDCHIVDSLHHDAILGFLGFRRFSVHITDAI